MDLRLLKPGHKIRTRDGVEAEVLSESEDGEWIKVRYVDGEDDPLFGGTDDLAHRDGVEALLGVAHRRTWGEDVTVVLHHIPESEESERGPLCLGCCSITQRDDASSEDPGARSAAAACKRADFPFFFGVFGCASVEQSRYDVPSPVSGSVTSLCVPPLRNEALQRFAV